MTSPSRNKLSQSTRLIHRAFQAGCGIALEERPDTIVSGIVQLVLYTVSLLLVSYNFAAQLVLYDSASGLPALSLIAMAAFFVFEGLMLQLSMRNLCELGE
jgi:hypothetical protein